MPLTADMRETLRAERDRIHRERLGIKTKVRPTIRGNSPCGTSSRYANGCRCRACTDAATARRAELRTIQRLAAQ